MGRCIKVAIAGVAYFVLATTESSGGLITIETIASYVSVDAQDLIGVSDVVGLEPGKLPALKADTGNGTTSNAIISFGLSKFDDFSLDVTFDQQRAGDPFALASTYITLMFTADVDASFALSGFYNFTSVGDNHVNMIATLYDVTDSKTAILFSDSQSSSDVGTGEYTFSVNGSGTDGGIKKSAGLLADGLIAGRTYSLTALFSTQAALGNDESGSANGGFSFTINATEPPVHLTPEPSSLMLCGLGAFGMSLLGIRRRRVETLAMEM